MPRRWLLRWLRELPAPGEAARDAVVGLAGEADAMTRAEVARTLGTLGWDPPGVLDALTRDPHQGVRAVTAWALGKVGADPRRIAELLRDPSFLVRGNAAEALAGHPDREAVRRIVVAAWSDAVEERPARRRYHLDLLAHLGETGLLARVAEADPDPRARLQARRLLDEGPPPWRP